MRAKDYPALVDAIDSGVSYGLLRADKYADDPLTEAQRDRVKEQVAQHVMSAICERFAFDTTSE
jgi:hypothetical protein